MIAAYAGHLMTSHGRRYCNRIEMHEPDDNAHAMPAVYSVCCDFRVLTVKTACPEFPKPPAVAVCLNGKNDGRSWKSGRRTKRGPRDVLSRTPMTVSRFDRFFTYVTIDWVCHFIGKSEVVLAFRSCVLHVTYTHVSATPTADTRCQFV